MRSNTARDSLHGGNAAIAREAKEAADYETQRADRRIASWHRNHTSTSN